ncbi:hypothetical protein Tco_0423806 [Tanacetum coccineum]
MESVKKSIGERTQHKTEYESRVNERQIQKTEAKTDTSNALDALDASSVIIENNGTESKVLKSQWLRYKRLLKSISLLQDNSILSNLNSIMKERLTRMLNNVMTHVLCLLH